MQNHGIGMRVNLPEADSSNMSNVAPWCTAEVVLMTRASGGSYDVQSHRRAWKPAPNDAREAVTAYQSHRFESSKTFTRLN